MWALDRAFHPVGNLDEGPQKGPGARLVGPGVGSLWAMRQPTSGRAAARARQQASGRRSHMFLDARASPLPRSGPACRHVDLSFPSRFQMAESASRFCTRTPHRSGGTRAAGAPPGWLPARGVWGPAAVARRRTQNSRSKHRSSYRERTLVRGTYARRERP